MDMAGVPGIGVKRAEALFERKKDTHGKLLSKPLKIKVILQETAITNARLARILTVDDYDFDKKEPNLMVPLLRLQKLTMEQDLKMRLIEDRLNEVR